MKSKPPPAPTSFFCSRVPVELLLQLEVYYRLCLLFLHQLVNVEV